jgi:iron-sulfur cluster insertion protein
MKVSLKAQIFITSNIEKDNKKFALLSVLSGGCNGMQYSLILIDQLPKYEVSEIAPNIYVDTLSLQYLDNSTVDLEESLGSRKIVIKNPDAKSSCSCGSSFSV